MIDLFSRGAVGWSLQPDMRRPLVIDALEMTWLQRSPNSKSELIFHSDRGSQYTSQEFRKALEERGITASMSREATAGTTHTRRRCSVR